MSRRPARWGTGAAALALLAAGCSTAAEQEPVASGTGAATAAAEPEEQATRTGDPGADETGADETGADETGDGHGADGDADTGPDGAHAHGTTGPAPKPRPLRPGEQRRTVEMPTAYTPSAPTEGGTDDYRCFLLDPGLTRDAWLTGTSVLPGNPEVVHHVILFRVPPAAIGEAEAMDEATPGPGWTCFGGSGIGGPELDDAPWLGAWAPGGGESVQPRGLGVRLERGSRIVMQVHYNLLAGDGPDVSSALLRTAPGSAELTPLHTVLMPAPVELPCRRRYDDGPLCDRDAAMADVQQRFGRSGRAGDLLHLLCGTRVDPGERTSCDRYVSEPTTIRAVAGHMHLLGREIRIVANPGTPRRRVLLDVDVWNFDDQGARRVRPVRLNPLDRVRVSCRHVQWLRDELPAFEGQPDRYVVWGEGTTDEMCLGTLLVTRP